MAVTQTQQLPAPFISALGEKYGAGLGQLAGQPFSQAQLGAVRPTVAPQTGLQQQATTLAGQVAPGGVAAYQPYVQAAGAAGTAAGTQLGLAGTGLAGAETGLAGLGAQYADPTFAGIQGAQATLGGVQPFIGAAETGLGGAGTTLGTAGTQLTGAGTAMGGAQQYITGAAGLTGTGAGTGAGSIADYMSPYQSQVIDTTLEEFDRQAAMRQQGISDAAVAMGGFGGGREGVMQSEYQAQSDKNRAAIEAQLQQQGFSQAQAARQADLASRLGIGGAQQQYASGLAGLAGARSGLAGQEAQFAQGQLGLGQATGALAAQQGALAQGYLAPGQFEAGLQGQAAGMAGQRAGLGQAQLGLGQYQSGLAGTTQALRQADIGTLGQVGAIDQAQLQAEEDARREYNRMQLYEPYERMGFFGQGLTGLMGGYPAQYQFAQQPNVSPLAGALGIASTVGGLYGNIYGKKD